MYYIPVLLVDSTVYNKSPPIPELTKVGRCVLIHTCSFRSTDFRVMADDTDRVALLQSGITS